MPEFTPARKAINKIVDEMFPHIAGHEVARNVLAWEMTTELQDIDYACEYARWE